MSENRSTRRALMAERDAALKAGDIQRFQAITTQLAAMPMKGVTPLTARDIERWVHA